MAGYGECWTWQRNGATPGIDKVLYLLERVSPFFGDALHFGVMCTADNYHRRIYALRFRVWMLPGASLRQPTCWWGYIQGSYVTRVQHILGKGSKAREIAATKLWLVLVLYLIGWESDASFLHQTQSEVKQCNLGLLVLYAVVFRRVCWNGWKLESTETIAIYLLSLKNS